MGTQNYDDGIVTQINPVIIRRKIVDDVPKPITYERFKELMKEVIADEHPEPN